MFFSEKSQNKIKNLYKNNDEMREKLLMGDADSVRKIVKEFEGGMSPEYIVETFNGGDLEAMKYLYEQAKRMVELKILYRELCLEFYKKDDEDTETITQTNRQSK